MKSIFIFFSLIATHCFFAQQVPIQSYSIDPNGQVRLTVKSSVGKYYILRARHESTSAFKLLTSMTIGKAGETIITEPLRAYLLNQYEVSEYSVDNPNDSDGDGLNDMVEYNAMPSKSPLNAAEQLDQKHALSALNTRSAFDLVSTHQNGAGMNDIAYTKFLILDFYSDKPKIYFINTNTYELHLNFTDFLGVGLLEPSVIKGQLISNPTILSANGTLGTYAFSYANNETQNFDVVQRTQELLAANMPFLSNNLSYFVTKNNEQNYQTNISAYQNSRVPVLFESDVYAGIKYWGLNQTEGYGFFRLMSQTDVPGSKDIVLYETLPNSLPRVGGMITSAIQTPLSHINLRAIHDHVPNAFIRDPLSIDTINQLLNHYIYFKTNQSNYEIREASLDEVNAWYDKIRPGTEQIPPLNTSYQTVLPLSSITFTMFDGFGAKAANVSTMRTFGFPEGTIPNGFAIPFYFYMEFMKHNNFVPQIEAMLKDPNFISDRTVRDAKLKKLRTDIKDASMPAWMMDQLQEMQKSFPVETGIRCRSSTNNEDLPGFSGAGLYDSKTHRNDEGHISKTIKQVYASLWNLRAFEEREFYRVNHLYAAMGVLCHPNFDSEKVNGVGVSADPVYDTDNTFYLNSQLGEELITNPENAYPEEVLLKRSAAGNDKYSVIQYSSLLNVDSLLMTDSQMTTLRDYLAVIHDRFAVLYKAENNPTFAMDIEFKIDSTNQLAIKQARPWVSYVPSSPKKIGTLDNCSFEIFPNPAMNLINIACENCGLVAIRIADLKGVTVFEKTIDPLSDWETQISIEFLPSGIYIVSGVMGGSVCKSLKLIKR